MKKIMIASSVFNFLLILILIAVIKDKNSLDHQRVQHIAQLQTERAENISLFEKLLKGRMSKAEFVMNLSSNYPAEKYKAMPEEHGISFNEVIFVFDSGNMLTAIKPPLVGSDK